jgi:hypothetical protein
MALLAPASRAQDYVEGLTKIVWEPRAAMIRHGIQKVRASLGEDQVAAALVPSLFLPVTGICSTPLNVDEPEVPRQMRPTFQIFFQRQEAPRGGVLDMD